jgi:hypothetical protein
MVYAKPVALFLFPHLVVHAQSEVTVHFTVQQISSLKNPENAPLILRIFALIFTEQRCALITKLQVCTTSKRAFNVNTHKRL